MLYIYYIYILYTTYITYITNIISIYITNISNTSKQILDSCSHINEVCNMWDVNTPVLQIDNFIILLCNSLNDLTVMRYF